MAENIKFEVVTPEKEVVSEQAQIVMAPGSMGEFGVLAGHTPFMTSLKTGIVHYRDENGKDKYVFVSGGFAEALPDKITILAESAELGSDINLARAESAKERAERHLAEKKADVDFERAHSALQRAMVRINIAGMQ
jgi:F-type H+-transporting ATPase subunit epsilon